MNAWSPQGQPPHDPYANGSHPPNAPYNPHPQNAPYPPHLPYPPHQPQGPYPPQAPYQPLPRRVGWWRRLWSVAGPIAIGRRVFKPSRPGLIEDETIGRIQKIRTAVGLAAVVWVTFSYHLVKSASDVVSDRLNQSWISVLVLAVTFPVIVGGFIAAARPLHRRELLRRSAKPLGSVLAIIGAVALFPAFVLTGTGSGGWHSGGSGALINLFGGLLLLVWVLPFVAYGVAMSLVYVFRTADIHEVVPPLLATVLVWEMALVDVFTGAYAGAPVMVRVLFILGAPLSVTPVSLWELRRLGVRGLTVRTALGR